jgi:class 3 adenylate cyclase
MKRLTSTITFDSTASRPKHGLALIYDLEGFSKFFNQPDAQNYVPKVMNEVSQAISTCIFGGTPYWQKNKKAVGSLGRTPVHEKFLGDGAMYLWADTPSQPLDSDFVKYLCNRLWNLKTKFRVVVERFHEVAPVVDVPQRIRFGLAMGTIYELRRKNSTQKEYIGFCINLASRLQKYCPDLGFIASARIGLSEDVISKNGYVRVVAKQIKGFPSEIVIVDKGEYGKLNDETKTAYFESL